MFEDMCALLSKTAFPVNSPLRSIHLISLEGLLAILKTLSLEATVAFDDEANPAEDSGKYYANIWTSLVEGREPLIEVTGKHACTSSFPIGIGGASGFRDVCALWSAGADGKAPEFAWVRSVQSEKYLKGLLHIAADHFNRDPKKGFQFLQVCRPSECHIFPLSCCSLEIDNHD